MIVVIGQPRSGTSLTMQMLNAVGIHCAGKYSSFEDQALLESGIEHLAKHEACKVVWPARPDRLPREARCIIIERRAEHQAISEVKLRELMLFNRDTWQRPPRRELRAMVKQWKRYQRQIEAWVGTRHQLRLSFDGLITNPDRHARRLVEFLIYHRLVPACVDELVAIAAAVPRERSIEPLPGLLELELDQGRA